MGLDETLAAIAELPAEVRALRREVAELRAEVAAMRASLPARSPLKSATEAARHQGVSISTMRRWIRDGRVPTVRVGRVVRVDTSKLTLRDADDISRIARRLTSV